MVGQMNERDRRTWRVLAMVAAIAAAMSFAARIAVSQETAPDPRLLDQLGIMMLQFGLDPQHNKIDAILAQFGFSCLTEGPLGSPCRRTEARLANLLREFPADLDDIARELGALGAACSKQSVRLECRYERLVVSTSWAAGYSGPLARIEDLFRIEFVVTDDGPLTYDAKLSRLAQSPAASAPPAADRAGSEDLSSQCSARLVNFVKELDEILTDNPPSVHPLLALLERTFPVSGCNVDEALKIARASKFLLVIDEWPKVYVIRFGNPRNPVHRGYSISFGLLKDSGNSELPSASVNK